MTEALSSLLRDDVDIMHVSRGDTRRRPESTVAVNVSYIQELNASRELNATIAKRFHGKCTRHTSPTYEQLVKWVLSSDGYKIREANLHMVSDEDVCDVWEFVDTMKVSSSDECRAMLHEMALGRGSEAFRRTMHIHKTPPRRAEKSVRVPRDRPTMLKERDGVKYTHKSIDDAIVEDMALFAISSEDPVATCRASCASFMRRN